MVSKVFWEVNRKALKMCTTYCVELNAKCVQCIVWNLMQNVYNVLNGVYSLTQNVNVNTKRDV